MEDKEEEFWRAFWEGANGDEHLRHHARARYTDDPDYRPATTDEAAYAMYLYANAKLRRN